MEMGIGQWITGFLGVVSISGLVMVYRARGENRKTNAEASSVTVDTSLKLLEPLREEIGRLTKRLSDAEEEVTRLRDEAYRLRCEAARCREQLERYHTLYGALP